MKKLLTGLGLICALTVAGCKNNSKTEEPKQVSQIEELAVGQGEVFGNFHLRYAGMNNENTFSLVVRASVRAFYLYYPVDSDTINIHADRGVVHNVSSEKITLEYIGEK